MVPTGGCSKTVQSTFTFNTLNRLTQLSTPSVAGYQYTLGPTGNPTSALELNGRAVTYKYDGVYRMTNETIANAPSEKNGQVAHI